MSTNGQPYPRLLSRVLLIAFLFVTTAHAQPEVSLNGSYFQPPDGDGFFLPLDQPPNFIFVWDDGTIFNTNSGSGDTIFLSMYSYREEPPANPPTIPVPGAMSPGIGGLFEDPGLPGDATTILLIDPADSSTGAEIIPSGQSLPPFAPDLAATLLDALQQLSDSGCEVFRISYDSEVSPYYYEEQFLQFDQTFSTTLKELPGTTLHSYHFFVHCSDRTNFKITVHATSDRNGLLVDAVSVKEVSPGLGSQGKGAALPIATLPTGDSTLTHQGATAFVYPAEAAEGNSGNALPTIGWINPDRTISDWFQIEGHDVGFASEIELCGSHFSDRLWLAWTGQDGNAKLARIIRPDAAEVFNLGPTTGFTVMDCDYWGNVVAAWATPSGDAINVRSYARTGNQASSASFDIDGQSFTPLSISINSNGEAALMFSDSSGTFIQKVDVNNVVEIDMSFAGSWSSPFFNGEGFIWDIAEVNGVPTLALYYFTYQSDGSGRQAWAVGSAEIVNGVATIPASITEGGIFGTQYNPDNVTLDSWGEIEVRILGCRRALMTMRSPSFGDHAYPAKKFTNSPLNLPGICTTGSAAAKDTPPRSLTKGVAQVDGSFTGSWFSPERSFEGFIFDVTESNGQPTLVVYWFSYDVANTGRQLWLVGSAAVSGNTANVDLVSASGPRFGPNYDPATTMLIPFGSVAVTFNGCNSVSIAYSVNGGESGSFDVQRLAALPPGTGGVCGS